MFGFASGYFPALMLLVRLQAPEALSVAESTQAVTIVLQTTGPIITSESAVLAASEENIEDFSTPPTPTPAPTATPDVWPPAEFAGWFNQYAAAFGVDVNILERIANCESHFNPTSESGNYLGMFQFSSSTWQSYRSQMGLDTSPDLRANPEESIKTAAYVVQQKGAAPWPSCLR